MERVAAIQVLVLGPQLSKIHKADIILKSSGVDVPTTNNKMELEGVIRGLKGLIEKWIEEGVSIERVLYLFIAIQNMLLMESRNGFQVGNLAAGKKQIIKSLKIYFMERVRSIKSQF